MTDRQQVLYRMYDQFDRLLYVGITMEPVSRFKGHEADKPWWPQVTTILLQHVDSREEVVAAEAQAILEEDPLYNIAGRPAMGPVKPPSTENHTKPRQLRIPDSLWKKFGESAALAGTNRARLINEFIRWYNREPGAKLPQRPALHLVE